MHYQILLITRSEVMEIFLAGMTLQMKDVAPNVAEVVKQYGNNKHKLYNCPKSDCDGKLHVAVSVSEVNDGLYLCDTCNATFKKKTQSLFLHSNGWCHLCGSPR